MNNIDKVLKDYEKYLKLLRKAQRTIREYVYTVKKIIRNSNITDVAEFDSFNSRWWLQWANDRSKEVSIQTTNKEVKQMSSFYQFLILEGYANNNPCYKLPTINTSTTSEFKEKVLTVDEVKSMLDILETRKFNVINRYHNLYTNLRDKLFINLLFNVGVRIEEASRIELNDIVLDENKLWIRGKGHGGNISRYNYFNDIVKEMIIKSIELRPNRTYLFENLNGGQMNTNSLREIWNKVVEEVGLEEFTPHSCRHFCGSQLVAQGVAIEKVSMFLGHTSVSTTNRYYVKATDELKDVSQINSNLLS